VKRVDLIRHLEAHGCVLLREGGNHTVFLNRPARKVSTVPRHREINEDLARKICKDLEVPRPSAETSGLTRGAAGS
jgi:mRNA interferase HicA